MLKAVCVEAGMLALKRGGEIIEHEDHVEGLAQAKKPTDMVFTNYLEDIKNSKTNTQMTDKSWNKTTLINWKTRKTKTPTTFIRLKYWFKPTCRPCKPTWKK